jgi:hypothetical protein
VLTNAQGIERMTGLDQDDGKEMKVRQQIYIFQREKIGRT